MSGANYLEACRMKYVLWNPAKRRGCEVDVKIVKKYPKVFIELAILLVLFTAAAAAPFVNAAGPLETSAALRLTPPSPGHIFGTDEFGRDILTRVCYGLRVSITVSLTVVTITTLAGVMIGLICGWFELADRIISRILDGLMAFPEIILAITLSAIWGAGEWNLIFALSFAAFPRMTRVVRSSVLSVKSQEHIQSGRAVGASTSGLIFRYVMPGCVSAITVQATFCFASAILSEAALSFLGVGVKEPAPSLGGMVSAARNYMTVAPWTILIPGAVIMVMVLVLNLMGDSLRDVLDPRIQTTR